MYEQEFAHLAIIDIDETRAVSGVDFTKTERVLVQRWAGCIDINGGVDGDGMVVGIYEQPVKPQAAEKAHGGSHVRSH